MVGRVASLVGNNQEQSVTILLCSVRRVGPACSSRYLLGALVATCPGASEMPLPAGKGLKNIWHQLFEVTCLHSQDSQLLSL